MERYYRTYSHFMHLFFGFPVSRISVDAGFLCPHRASRDGGGCIYCNNESFSSGNFNSPLSVKEQIAKAVAARKKPPARFITYFQSYTNTFGPIERLEALYHEALTTEGCVGIAVGTRPDCIDDEVLSLLERLGRTGFITVEYGLQSPYRESLRWMNRGHDFECFVDAVRRTAERGLYVGAHLILGIPGESRQMMLDSAFKVSELPIHFLKLHQLQIVKNTELALQFSRAPFPLWEIDDYADFLCDFIERLRSDIVIQRLYSLCRHGLLIGPDWKLNGHEIDRILHNRIRERSVQQGRYYPAETRDEKKGDFSVNGRQ